VVVAVVVSGPFAVVQQTVAALFQRQRAVGAQVELVAIVRVGVRLFADFLRTLRRLLRAVFLASDRCETTIARLKRDGPTRWKRTFRRPDENATTIEKRPR